MSFISNPQGTRVNSATKYVDLHVTARGQCQWRRSSSSCRTASTDFPNSLSLSLSRTICLYHPLLLAGLLDYILCLYRAVVAGRPILALPYEEVHWRTSLLSSSLLLQQCPTFLVRFWMIFAIGGRRPYICWFVECCFPYLFNIARSILA